MAKHLPYAYPRTARAYRLLFDQARPARVGGDVLRADDERSQEYASRGMAEPGFGSDLAGNPSFLSHLP